MWCFCVSMVRVCVMTQRCWEGWSKGEANTPRLISHGASVTGHRIGRCQVFTWCECECVSLTMWGALLVSKKGAWVWILHLQVKDQIVESFLWYAVVEPHCDGGERERNQKLFIYVKYYSTAPGSLPHWQQQVTVWIRSTYFSTEHWWTAVFSLCEEWFSHHWRCRFRRIFQVHFHAKIFHWCKSVKHFGVKIYHFLSAWVLFMCRH